MLKVIVIDDEKLIRRMIITSMNWEEAGFEVVGEASSARMGMDLIDQLHPDLVLMDVRMPGMDGLTCSRLVLEKHPKLKIIIVSGHDEFEYASEGIRLGVFDYLLKPINTDELKNAVRKAKDAILEEKNNREEMQRFKEELEKHAGYIRDRQLSSLVRSRTPAQYLDSLAYFGVKFTGDIFQVAVVEIQTWKTQMTEEEKILTRMHARKMIEDYYADQEGMFVCDGGSEWLILLNNRSQEAIYEGGEELKQYLENNIDAPVCIGVGNVCTEMDHLCDSYREAKDALQYSFVSKEENLICFRDIYPYYNNLNASVKNEDIIHEIGNAIRTGDAISATQTLGRLMDRIRKAGEHRSQVIAVTLQVAAEILQVLSELSAEEEDGAMQQMLTEVFALETFDQIQDYLKQTILDACAKVGHVVSDKEKDLVHKVRDYIRDNYAQEDLSLNALAGQYYTNPSYLSRVFKEKTGTTYSSYVTEVRMKAAQKLILTTDLKSYEIAEQVGIPDPHYFSASFKKYTGMSVSEYKKSGGM